MSVLDLAVIVALLGAGAVARGRDLVRPPEGLLEHLDLLEDLSMMEDEEAP